MLKRSVAFLLVFLLAFGSLASAMGETMPKQVQKKEKPVSKGLKQTEDPNKEQRVIIELKAEAPIEISNKQGVQFKKLGKVQKQQLESNVKAQQKVVKENMKEKKIEAKILKEFTAVVNGFSAEVKHGDIELIKKMPEVKSVHIVNEYERPVIKPDMKYSKELVEAQESWRDYGYKGEGMVVGIIDTGIDYNHRDMTLTDHSKAEFTQKTVNQAVKDYDLPGKFYTEKVPYGYNYMDENDEVRDIYAEASMHGMHVAGTVGANGDEENGGIQGIAPETQLLALKVFGNDPEMPTTFGDIYVKAIDDAIKLGVDVLNLSLGSSSSFVDPESPEQRAIKRAVENGVLMSISAGNSALFADGFYYPLASNPDYGVSGTPGISYDSLQVASFENTFMDVDALAYSIADKSGTAAFLSAGKTHPNDQVKKTFDVVEVGFGTPEEMDEQDVKGKYALVQRGEIAFTEKAFNAQDAGANGVIIYNNADGIVNMATEDDIDIPQLFMLKNDGEKLAAALKNAQAVSLTFSGESATIDNPNAGKMSDFTSWGLTPNLDFKPEITAPGGQILSSLNNDKYGLMSGTSMAAPHVSGGGALVLQRVDEAFGLENADRILRAKNLMMNTAKQVEFDGAKVSPRRQGAGMMQLHAALSTPVIVTESKTNEAKVALKQVTDNKVTFELTAENLSNETVTYDVKANAQTDQFVQNGSDMLAAPNLFGALDLGDAVTVNGEKESLIGVPANGKEKITVIVDVSAVDATLASTFTNGYWLEGFVTLTDPTDRNPQLAVPYVGFKGEWDKAPILDKPMWDTTSYYGMTGIVTSLGEDEYGFLGEELDTGEMNPEKIAFSPNGDGVQDDSLMILSFLRNAKEVKFNVLDANQKVVRTLTTETEVRKNYYDGGLAPMYSLSETRAWDGKVNGKQALDGQYYLQVEAVIDFSNAKWQSLSIPVRLDTAAPEVDASFDAEKQKMSVEAKDEATGSGLAYWDVLIDGKSILEQPYTAGKTEHQLKNQLEPEQTLTVVAVDYAGNSTEAAASEGKDTTAPDLHLLTPEFLGIESTKNVAFSGYVKDKSGIKSVTVDGKKAKLVYNAEEDQYDFNITIKHRKDGYYFNHIKAIDQVGNETEIGRRYFVDTTKAKMKIKGAKNKVDTDSVILSADITDNFDDIRLYVNDSEVFKNELSEPYGMHGFKKTVSDIELQLEEGKNIFLFKTVDLGGNITEEKVTITKKNKKK